MKTMTRSWIYLAMAALALTATLATPAWAQQHVPFKGTFQGSDAVNAPIITTSGTGVGAHLGAFSLQQVLAVTTSTGTARWVAANGDRIDSTFVASADFSTAGDGYITVTETHTVTGGTGRFVGVQGSFVLVRTHLTVPNADGTHVTYGSYQGSITPPGATQ